MMSPQRVIKRTVGLKDTVENVQMAKWATLIQTMNARIVRPRFRSMHPCRRNGRLKSFCAALLVCSVPFNNDAMSQPAPLPDVEVQTLALQATSVAPKTAAFGVYLNGRIPVGAYHVEVFTAPKQGVDVQSHWTMRLGPSWIQRSATTRLDSSLRMRTQKHRKGAGERRW